MQDNLFTSKSLTQKYISSKEHLQMQSMYVDVEYICWWMLTNSFCSVYKCWKVIVLKILSVRYLFKKLGSDAVNQNNDYALRMNKGYHSKLKSVILLTFHPSISFFLWVGKIGDFFLPISSYIEWSNFMQIIELAVYVSFCFRATPSHAQELLLVVLGGPYVVPGNRLGLFLQLGSTWQLRAYSWLCSWQGLGKWSTLPSYYLSRPSFEFLNQEKMRLWFP